MIDEINFQLDDFNPQAIAEKLSKKMKIKRLFFNMTQKDLADRSGVSYGSVKRFEIHNEISLKHLLRIALVLESLYEFHSLFPTNTYQTVDDILQIDKVKERKRARNG